MITEYDFGRIVVKGKEYNGDLIIFRNRVVTGWWRKEGHRLLPNDLDEVLKEKPEILVVGTGRAGLMRIDPKTKKLLENHDIDLISERTEQAIEIFNNLVKEHKVAGAFHLTC